MYIEYKKLRKNEESVLTNKLWMKPTETIVDGKGLCEFVEQY